jgi:hypothetical protein
LKNLFSTLLASFKTDLLIAGSLAVFVATVSGQSLSSTESSSGTHSTPAANSISRPNPTGSSLAPNNESRKPESTPAIFDAEGWSFEIRPYIWLAGIDGRLRVGNTQVETGKSSSDVLGMLDFAAAAQVEAIKGRWRLMFDENYVNLGTTGTGPLGNVSIDVEPTMNIFEFGGSYTMVAVENKKATVDEPLPPVFTAEVLGGGRFLHLGLELEPANTASVEGSRNFVGVFIGNRFKASPHKAITLIGKYTVGTSGAGSNTAWSAEGLVDLRLKRSFSVAGGYRALGMNTDKPSNRIGFNGTLHGLIFTMTLYR